MANEAARFHPRGEDGAFLPATDRRQLTERQAAFAIAYVENGGNGAAAALSAGYGEKSASSNAYHLLRQPWVLRAIEIERRKLLAQVGVASLKVILDVLRDTGCDRKLRVKAAEIGVKADRADRDARDNPADGKRLAEMSISELEALIRRLDQAQVEAAKPQVEGTAEHLPPDNVAPPQTNID